MATSASFVRRRPAVALATAALAILVTAAAVADPAGESTDDETEEKTPPTLLGEVDRSQIETAEPGWVAAQVAAGEEAEIDGDAAAALATVPPGAELTIYFGTWCGDSKREIARFWSVLDEAADVPVDITYIAVDRRDQRPPELADEVGLYWVPTFIVERDGQELGRVVESADDTLERDLLALLRGEAKGVLTGRDDGAAAPTDGQDDGADGPEDAELPAGPRGGADGESDEDGQVGP